MRIKWTFIFVFILGIGSVFSLPAEAQPSPTVSKKAQKWYEEAQQQLKYPTEAAMNAALQLLDRALKQSPDFYEASLLSAGIFFKQKNYPKAVEAFRRIEEEKKNLLKPYLNTYAKSLAGIGDFSRALELMELYLKENKLSEKNKELALDWKKRFVFAEAHREKDTSFVLVNMGDSVNSKEAEYFPSLTIDGKQLIFTRNINGKNEDFFMSEKTDSGWSEAKPLPESVFEEGYGINSSRNEGAGSISQDGKALLFAICDAKDGLGSCDIYFSFKSEGRWSKPQNMGAPVNSRYWDSQPSLSPDGKDLYFVSNRPGGKGKGDIYVSHIQSDGWWGEPVNLGDSINTSGEESSPFIHADNQTLYFSSTGHEGIGDADLFYARKKPDGSWGKPHNLGYPINTIDHEGSLFVSADGKTAYFASDREDSRGLLDLYQFELSEQARPVKTLFVQGKVFDQKSRQPVSAVLELVDLQTGKERSRIRSEKDGSYLVTLPVGKEYGLHVSEKGYIFYSDHFSLPDSIQWQPFFRDIPLQPLEDHAKIVLKNLFFDLDKAVLKEESYPELKKIVKLAEDNPGIKIGINGYTDSTGSEAHNRTLSQQRAQAVVDYLVSRGISEDRLKAKGWGAENPVAPNDTKEGRAKNRRTEMEILQKEE